jgi:uncharacterized protein YaiI (UPF0178 family)
MTHIYIDADACPVREEALRVAERRRLFVTIVSNGSRPIRPPAAASVTMIIVPPTPDAADNWIAEHIGAGDICVTDDIPLAARCLAKGAGAISAHGHVWTDDNIGSALAGREMSRHLREIGQSTGGGKPLSKADRSKFLSAFDTNIERLSRGRNRDAAAAVVKHPPYRDISAQHEDGTEQ